MANGRLSEFAHVCQGQLVGEDSIFTGISTDTRILKANNLFIALQGPNFDAHEFLDQAKHLGAVGFAVSVAQSEFLPHVIVPNTRLALADFAAHWRQRFSIPVAAITGSNGKTSTKEMLASILRIERETLATSGNMNNDIGVPLTLFKMKFSHKSAVIEVGTNAPGEIAFLTKLVQPTVGIVTNASSAHLAGLGDVAGVAVEKGALFENLDQNATAVINADDKFSQQWREQCNAGTTLMFGGDSKADFSFSNLTQTVKATSAQLRFELATPNGTRQMMLPMAGAHNARNAAAAAAGAYAMGVDLDVIEQGLANANGIAGRMQIQKARCGARLIDDSYNSNPASARAALDFLAEQNEPGWLVLGDMGELGSNAPDMHASIGKYARSLGIEKLFALGKNSRAAVAAFGDGATWFENRDELIEALENQLDSGINLLVKGSRSMELERVTAALRDSGGTKVAHSQGTIRGVSEC